MSIPAGTWVEVERVLLQPEQRSTALPEETRTKPFVVKVSGFLVADAELGDEAVVRSLIGHEHHGVITAVNPSYAHTFGETVQDLLHIGLADDPSLPEGMHHMEEGR